MLSLSTVRSVNAGFAPSYTPVAIFVGGTSGIGQGMAEAFARHTNGNAHIVLVGRNRAAAEAILATFPKPAIPGISHEFVECDISLMKNVRLVAKELSTRTPKINFLVLTPGVMTLNGRNETEEGIDRKLAVHYYGRWRFIRDLLPGLESATKAGEDAKVMTVLSAGHGGTIDIEDLGLKKSYSLAKAAAAAPTYSDIMINDLAVRYPGLSLLHSFPGGVRTGLLKASDSPFLRILGATLPLFLTPFTYSVEAAGEHQLYALLKAGARTDDRSDDIGLTKGYYGNPEAMARLWKHTEDETSSIQRGENKTNCLGFVYSFCMRFCP
ncbi:NAD(P)-binding protein [Mycena alexandri]|uniref:NAD(P)-binding protein n=1 Tax=Mycena alexandri TaxID=1745969 RepID=A0AAD6WX47_9AGAR|nr:NAD(P)-binding protein [Mycena alexandri]